MAYLEAFFHIFSMPLQKIFHEGGKTRIHGEFANNMYNIYKYSIQYFYVYICNCLYIHNITCISTWNKLKVVCMKEEFNMKFCCKNYIHRDLGLLMYVNNT